MYWGVARSFVDAYPDLLWETIALIKSHGESFVAGFRSVPAGFTVTDRLLTSLQAVGVPETVLVNVRRLKDQEFDTQDRFVSRVSEGLASEEWENIKEFVLTHAANRKLADDDPAWKSRPSFLQYTASIGDPYLRFRAE